MLSGSWCLYERRSNRWIFCRRKQLLGTPLITLLGVVLFWATAWGHF